MKRAASRLFLRQTAAERLFLLSGTFAGIFDCLPADEPNQQKQNLSAAWNCSAQVFCLNVISAKLCLILIRKNQRAVFS